MGELADDPFGRAPVGSGPFVLTELDDDHAVLEPAAAVQLGDPGAEPVPAAIPSDPLGTVTPTRRPDLEPKLGRMDFRFFDEPADLEAAFKAGELDAASGLAAGDAVDLAASRSSSCSGIGATLTTVLLNLRPSHPELRDPRSGSRCSRRSTGWGSSPTPSRRVPPSPISPIPPTSWAFDSTASAPVATDVAAAAAALTKAGWTKVDERWRPPGTTAAYTLEILSPDAEMNPALFAVAQQLPPTGRRSACRLESSSRTRRRRWPRSSARARLPPRIVDISIGHDPDLYPLLASSQVRTGGLNVAGVQDAALDALLMAARQPGTDEARKAAYTALQTQLTAGRYVLPIAFADEVVVVRDTLEDVLVQPVSDGSDRYWDVLTWRLANGR